MPVMHKSRMNEHVQRDVPSVGAGAEDSDSKATVANSHDFAMKMKSV